MICDKCMKDTDQFWRGIGGFEILCQDCFEDWEDEDFEEWIMEMDKIGEVLNDNRKM